MFKVKCEGLRFRAYSNSYFDEKRLSLNHKEGLRFLKRESCKCKECLEILEIFENGGHDILEHVYWSKTIGVVDLQDGDTYKMDNISFIGDSDEGYGIEEFEMVRIDN